MQEGMLLPAFVDRACCLVGFPISTRVNTSLETDSRTVAHYQPGFSHCNADVLEEFCFGL